MKIVYTLLSITLLVTSTQTLAGQVQSAPVQIDTINRFATGDMATARFSKNENELIGCGVRKTLFGTELGSFAFCQARVGPESVDGDFILCTTTNPGLVDAIQSFSDYSYITFSWDENNECTRIGNSTQSGYIPAFRLKKK